MPYTSINTVACLGILWITIPVLVQSCGQQMQTYQSESFLIQYPVGWLIGDSRDDYVIITNFELMVGGGTAPPKAIKTDVGWIPGSFQQVVSNGLENNNRNSLITHHENLIINERESYRIWSGDSDFDFPNAVITYISYTDEKTAFVVSFYTAENPEAVDIIKQIHRSFQILQ